VGWALGAVGALAGAAVLARRRRGGRNDGLPTSSEVDDVLEDLHDAGGHHGGRKHRETWYQFNIKAHAWAPDEVVKALGERAVSEEIGFRASNDLEWLHDDLREKHPWIGKKWHTAGRSGGWLLLEDDEAPGASVEAAAGDVHWIPALSGEKLPWHDDPDIVNNLVETYAAAKARVAELEEIRKEIQAVVKGFEDTIKDPDTWAEMMEWRRETAEEEDDEGAGSAARARARRAPRPRR
jgi:hypothetical protein